MGHIRFLGLSTRLISPVSSLVVVAKKVKTPGVPFVSLPRASYSGTTTVPQPIKRHPTPLEKVDEEPFPVSPPIGGAKTYEPQIVKLVEEISQLTLLQVADLNELLKKTLNIPDAPMMGAMSFAAGPMAAAPAEEEEEAAAPQKIQTSFTLQLQKFDETKKVALIKECKSLLEGMNLVQAKKFVESAPCVVKADIPKDEAEKLKTSLEAVGATCEII